MSVASDLDAVVALLHRLEGQHEAAVARHRTLRETTDTLHASEALLTLAGTAFDQLLQAMSSDSLVAIERLVTYGLRTTFTDLDLAFFFRAETQRGQQWLEPRLRLGAVDAPILSAFGGGPAAVVGFLLRLLVVRKLRLAPVMLLDETFSFVSEQYLDGLGRLLRELADSLGMTLVLVTHQAALATHAETVYQIGGRPETGVSFTLQ